MWKYKSISIILYKSKNSHYAERPFKNNVLDYIINVHIALMFQLVKVGLRQRWN